MNRMMKEKFDTYEAKVYKREINICSSNNEEQERRNQTRKKGEQVQK